MKEQTMDKMAGHIPLAERMRPENLDDFIGQGHLLGPDKLLRRLIGHGKIPSLMLWGPPGVGKTTLAHILARSCGANFVFFSAVLSGIKEVREIVGQAKALLNDKGPNTILFVDEIHRFNKSQQDAFLPHVESGLLTIIGATTENPSFQIIAPLLSRCQVLVLNPLTPEEIRKVIVRTLTDTDRGLGNQEIILSDEAMDHLVRQSDGDARSALNSLDIALSITEPDPEGRLLVDISTIEEAIQHRSLRYDANGEEHYNLISALHKSLRDSDPDGALYWLCRMLASGEEPLYIARRLIRFASEDVGNADPLALTLTISARDSFQTLGTPEGELALAQAVIYLATAPKSNATYMAYNKVMDEIRRTGSLPVPLHIRNAPTKLMKTLGYGEGYKYAHDHEGGVVFQEHLPEELSGRKFYHPTNRGHEAIIADRLAKWQKILSQQAAEQSGKKRRVN
ncbi:MAG: replication-associated recombination protein A [Proteobacteria bacterium]|nr:replication-associated recombination protein A [Pseudomonadota bacterium]MBU1738697.1 replication-associated recombination protein A [Pseudomonadota bacterium]